MTLTATEQDAAVEHFAAKLRFETDPSDVAAALAVGEEFVLVDARGEAPWRQGRIAGAIHLPHALIPERAPGLIPTGTPVVVYCWGPGCNGSTRAALRLAELGYTNVRELIGGFEYWAREGLPVVDDEGSATRAADPLTAPLGSIVCDC